MQKISSEMHFLSTIGKFIFVNGTRNVAFLRIKIVTKVYGEIKLEKMNVVEKVIVSS